MESDVSSQLFRVDHVKKHSYHLIIQKNRDSIINRDYENLNEYDYSVAIFGQVGYVLEYENIRSNGLQWRRDNILKRFKDDIMMDEDAITDASLDVEAEFISRRFYLNSIKSSQINKDEAQVENIITELNDSTNSVEYVLDCTCGIGGNIIHLATNFICIGVDVSLKRCEICNHNLKVYGLSDRAIIVNSDITTFLDSIDFNNPQSFKKFGIDVTKPPFDGLLKQGFSWSLISPPWGGTNYPGSTDMSKTYHFDDIKSLDIRYIVSKLATMSDCVSLMLPRSQNIPDLIHLSQRINLPFVNVDLLYKTSHSPLPRLCYVHFTSNLMDKCGQVNRKKNNMSWDILDIKECVDVAIPINYNQGKINLIGSFSINTIFNDIHSSSFARALGESILSAIGEPIHTLPRLIDIIESLGTREIQLLLQDTNKIYHSCGMTYTIDGVVKNRTFGGIFFYLFKIRHQNIYRKIEKKHKLRKLQNVKNLMCNNFNL